ncbi:MAG: DNA gyrase C-terminal beta-propeller domain-containing protein [Anaerolineae bacterium]
MMNMQRPDLSGIEPEVRAYIEALEAEVARLSPGGRQTKTAAAAPEPSEPPTTMNVITLSAGGVGKRTPRHLYGLQRRGGMGVFDLDNDEDDPPAILTVADESRFILLFSNYGRAFRLPVEALGESPVRSRGEPLAGRFQFRPHERLVAALPGGGGAYVALVSQRGWVRRVRGNYLGKSLIPGMSFHDAKEGGYLAAACWTPGDGDLFIATRLGRGIRFKESQVPTRGCRGMRIHVDDAAVAVAAVNSESGVFLLSGNGKGTVRLMTGFSANKAPGAGGKVAMKTDNLVGAVAVSEEDDLFIISRLGKIIRFRAAEVPAKAGVVQGVHCIALRADTAAAVCRA